MTYVTHPNIEGIFYDTSSDYDLDYSKAGCQGTPTEVFFFPNREEGHEGTWLESDGFMDTTVQSTYNMLKRVCIACPILTDCFRNAVESEEYGYFGGTSPTDRARVRERNGIALNVFDDDSYDAMILASRIQDPEPEELVSPFDIESLIGIDEKWI